MRFRSRLQRLEEALAPPPGCRACHSRRGLIKFATAKRLANGEVVSEAGPPPCTVCGKVAEFIIEVFDILEHKSRNIGGQTEREDERQQQVDPGAQGKILPHSLLSRSEIAFV